MNKTGQLPEDFYNFSGLRHLSQKGIEILEFYTTFDCIPEELQQFFKRTIDYYSLRKQKDGELDLYAELPYYLRPWKDLDEYESTSTAQPANNEEETRPEDTDFSGYDPAASACAGASSPLHDPFDSDSPASPLFHAPSSPAMDSNGYDDPSSTPIHRAEEEQHQESHARNEEAVDHRENHTASVALIGDGTFYCPFVIVDEPSPAETVAPPAEVADSKEFFFQERSASNQSPTITSSVLEAVDDSLQHSTTDEIESEPTASGSTDSVAPPSSSLFQGIQEFLNEEANLTLILPVAPPSPSDLQIDESSESTAGDDENEETTKPDEHRDEIDPVAAESIPAALSVIDGPTDDQLVIEEKEEDTPMELTKKTETPSTSNPANTVEAVAEGEMDSMLESQEEEAKEEAKDKEEPPKKKRRFSWNESSEAMEPAAVDSAAAGTSSNAPPARLTVSPAEDVKSDPSNPSTPPPIPRSSISTSSVEKPKPNDSVVTNKNSKGETSPSTSTAPPAASTRVDEKQDNSSPSSSLPSPPPIATCSTAKSNATVVTNHKPPNARPAHQSHRQRQPHASTSTNKQIPAFTPTRPPHNFHAAQPPPPFQPMNGPFSHPPPNMMGGGFPFNNMHGAPPQQMGGPFQQQNRPYQPPGPGVAGPWDSQWVPLSTWSAPNGPPQFTPNVHWSPLGPYGPMMAGPPGNAFAPGEYCAFCDSMQPHASEDCGRYGTWASREARARDMNLCPHCLGKHNPRCCPDAQRPCPNCGKHNSHVAFCLYRQ